jgi:transposase InsO family protein
MPAMPTSWRTLATPLKTRGSVPPKQAEDLVQRPFVAERPRPLWVVDVTQQLSGQGWLHLAAVIDVFSRRVIG